MFLLLFAVSLATGWGAQWLVLFALVMLHEMGHVAAALAFGYRVREVEVLPFGGVAKLEHGSLGWNPKHEVWIAIAGPAVNFLLIALLVIGGILGIGNHDLRVFMLETNITLAFFNLLPGLPLDGGRILRAAIASRIGFLQATEVASRMSFALSILIVAVSLGSLGLGYVNLGMATLGIFLFFSAWQLRKQKRYDWIRFLDAKRRQEKAGVRHTQILTVSPSATLEEVAFCFLPDVYHSVSVFNRYDGTWIFLSEDEILHAMFEGTGPKTRVEELL